MPHRFIHDTLGAAFIWTASVSGLIAREDWENAIGPYGGLFVSLVMLTVFILHSRSRIRKDDTKALSDRVDNAAREERDRVERERHHAESLAAQDRIGAKFEALHIRQMGCQLETTKSLLKLGSAVEKMAGRPCQVPEALLRHQTYTGHVPCLRCGKKHWMFEPCEPGDPATQAPITEQ